MSGLALTHKGAGWLERSRSCEKAFMRSTLFLGVVLLSVSTWAVRAAPELRAFVTPGEPLFLRFDGVTPPDAGTSSFTIQNVGLAPLTVTSIDLFGDDAGVFAVTGASTPSLPPGSGASIVVRFSPAVAGSYSARVLISSDDPLRRNEDIVLCGWTNAGQAPQCEAASPPPLPAIITPMKQGCSSVAALAPLAAVLLLRRRRTS